MDRASQARGTIHYLTAVIPPAAAFDLWREGRRGQRSNGWCRERSICILEYFNKGKRGYTGFLKKGRFRNAQEHIKRLVVVFPSSSDFSFTVTMLWCADAACGWTNSASVWLKTTLIFFPSKAKLYMSVPVPDTARLKSDKHQIVNTMSNDIKGMTLFDSWKIVTGEKRMWHKDYMLTSLWQINKINCCL